MQIAENERGGDRNLLGEWRQIDRFRRECTEVLDETVQQNDGK